MTVSNPIFDRSSRAAAETDARKSYVAALGIEGMTTGEESMIRNEAGALYRLDQSAIDRAVRAKIAVPASARRPVTDYLRGAVEARGFTVTDEQHETGVLAYQTTVEDRVRQDQDRIARLVPHKA